MAGVPMVGVAPYMVAGASLDSGGGPTKQVVFLHSGERSLKQVVFGPCVGPCERSNPLVGSSIICAISSLLDQPAKKATIHWVPEMTRGLFESTTRCGCWKKVCMFVPSKALRLMMLAQRR